MKYRGRLNRTLAGALAWAFFGLQAVGHAQIVTNVANDGTTVANLVKLTNLNGTGGATVDVTVDDPSGALAAAQSADYSDFPARTAWYAASLTPSNGVYSVLASVKPYEASSRCRVGVIGWLDNQTGKGIVFQVIPGGSQSSFQISTVDFNSASADQNETQTNLFNLDGTPAALAEGSAISGLGDYAPDAFATMRLMFSAPTTADKTALSSVTAHVTAKVMQTAGQGGTVQVGTTLELLTDLPLPRAHSFGYFAAWANVDVPGDVIGYLDDLTFVGAPGRVNIPPTVSLTSPVNGARFATPAAITLSAAATDTDGRITSVKFYQDSTLVGTSTNSPYQAIVSGLGIGSYTFTAKALDNDGGVATSAQVAVEVVAQAQPATLADPAALPGATNFQEFKFTVTGIAGASYEVEAGATLTNWTLVSSGVAPSDSFPLTFPKSSANYLFYRVKVGGEPSPTNKPPVVSISSPTNGASFAAPAKITITANASDPDGSVTRVEFYTGTNLVGTATTSPYSVTTATLSSGSYSLTAKAIDDTGAGTVSAPIVVQVTGSTVPPSLKNPTLLPSRENFQQFRFSASIAPGANYRVDSSSDLTHWSEAKSGTAATATTDITFPRNSTGPALFYRVVIVP